MSFAVEKGMKQQIVSISFFSYKGFSAKWWAFQQMGLVGGRMKNTPGLQFFKLLGSGAKKGFSIWPNFGVYALLSVWESETAAAAYFEKHPSFLAFQEKSEEHWTIFMRTAQVHGQWDGSNPFRPNAILDKKQVVGILTRATIYPKHLYRFWRFVPSVSASVHEKKGLLFSIGIGELPLIQQATFSFWESSEAMIAYAYKSRYHKEVIQKTRALGWYSEELFARFVPYKSNGSWKGQNPIAAFL